MSDINKSLGDDLTEYMLRGLLDRFLEYGYLQFLQRQSDDGIPVYEYNTRYGTDTVKVVVTDGMVAFTYVSPDVTQMRYVVDAQLDIHLRVTDLKLTVRQGTPKQAAEHFHTVLRRVIINLDTNGNVRRDAANVSGTKINNELYCAI